MLFEMDLRVQMDAKSGQLKNKSTPGDEQESANETTIMRLMCA